jgi:hypothetical protein
MEMEIVKNLLWSVAGLFVVFAMAVLVTSTAYRCSECVFSNLESG